MPPDSADEARAWLARTVADLRAAEVDLKAEPPLVEDALFHCQQAVEKLLKAFLIAHGHTFRKTHDLDVLASQCEAIDCSLTGALDDARDLTAFAWIFRYPGDWMSPPDEEGEQSLRLARQVYVAIVTRLPEDARP